MGKAVVAVMLASLLSGAVDAQDARHGSDASARGATPARLQPSAMELRATPRARAMLGGGSARLAVVESAGGGRQVSLGGTFLSLATVRIEADGRHTFGCGLVSDEVELARSRPCDIGAEDGP